MSENKEIDDDSFRVLLYISRIELTGNNRLSLQNQITSIIAYFKELEKFKDENIDTASEGFNSENDLRLPSAARHIEQNLLKSMTKEFMDGYFRSPKVLSSS